MQIPEGTVLSSLYRVERTLGSGGMGLVVAATELTSGRSCALKLLRPELIPDERSRQRFVQEARIASQVASPHVVRVLGSGVDAALGVPWIAMERLEGLDLRARVEARGALTHHELWALLGQVCSGLAAAHASHVVHRDLKPENLHLGPARDPAQPFFVTLLDFGIARAIDADRTSATATSALGSPYWMAPEQADAGSRVRPASDVWSLGLLAFYACTGRPYFRTAWAPSATLQSVLAEILVLPLDRPSARAREVGAEWPEAWDAWFLGCVERDPIRRFADATAAWDAAPIHGRSIPATALFQGATLHEAQATDPIATTAGRPGSAPSAPIRGVVATTAMAVPATTAMPASVPPTRLGMDPATPPSWGASPATSVPASAPPTAHAAASQPGSQAAPAAAPTSPATAGLSGATWFVAGLAVAGLGTLLMVGVALLIVGVYRARQPMSAREALAEPDASYPPDVVGSLDAGSDVSFPDAGRSPRRAVSPATAVTGPVEAPTETPEEEGFPDGTTRRFAGDWTGAGWRYRVVVELSRRASALEGTLHWTLSESPDPLFAARIGQSADESVVGTIRGDRIVLRGIGVTDDSLVGADEYELVLSEDRLVGNSRSQGGRLRAHLVD